MLVMAGVDIPVTDVGFLLTSAIVFVLIVLLDHNLRVLAIVVDYTTSRQSLL
jgi:hypothetical protein